MKLRRMLCSFLIVAILSVQCDIPVKANTDYLSITLADIIVAWYNASGVAIGSSELFNAIQDTYGSITINDLIENDCFIIGGAPDNDYATDKDVIRDMIGYGSLTAPAIGVRPDKLMLYLQGFPIRESARDSLMAMFGNVTGDDLPTEVFSATLGFVIGMVANLGKIGNDIDQAVIQNIGNYWQRFNEWWPVKTLKGVYRKFTDSTYFQDLIHTEDNPVVDYNVIGNVPSGYDGYGGIAGFETYIFFLKEHVFPVLYGRNFGNKIIVWRIYNLTDKTQYVPFCDCEFDGNNIIVGNSHQQTVPAQSYAEIRQYPYMDFDSSYISRPVYGYCLNKVGEAAPDMETARLEDPWGSSGQPGGSGNGVTNYINNSVGNIASDNYINLSPNIGNNEYMYIFDRLTYIEELNQITQNTDNGNYSQNSTVINNYNNQYIQGGVPDVRPTSAPASNPEVQPEMPFVSPRPTQPPEFVEQVVQEGGLSEEITKKFPFCIPWDIKALVDNLWAPEARAPYIHWEATFGEWGKLGEVTLDFSEFDPAARIFRSTTLLLWIVGLVLITRNLIG